MQRWTWSSRSYAHVLIRVPQRKRPKGMCVYNRNAFVCILDLFQWIGFSIMDSEGQGLQSLSCRPRTAEGLFSVRWLAHSRPKKSLCVGLSSKSGEIGLVPFAKQSGMRDSPLLGVGRSILCSAQDFNWSDKAHSHYGVWSALVQYITSWPHPEIASQTDSASCVTKFLGTTQPRQSTWLRNSTEIIHFSDLTTPSSPTPTMLVRNLHLSQILLLSSPRACGASRAC